jgi:hypothetical protein
MRPLLRIRIKLEHTTHWTDRPSVACCEARLDATIHRDRMRDGDAVDSSILVNALSEINARHWKNVPGT